MYDPLKNSLKKLDIDPFSNGQKSIEEGLILEEIRIEMESQKMGYNSLKRQLNEKKEDKNIFLKHLSKYEGRPGYEFILEDIQGIDEEINELETKIKSHPYKDIKKHYDYLRQFVIADPPISSCIIDKITLKYFLVPQNSKDFFIYLKEGLSREDAKRWIYLDNYFKRFKNFLREVFEYCKKNKEALELKDVFAYRTNNIYTYRFEFTDGLIFELVPDFPFSPRITFNAITYDTITKLDYNFILVQNKYQALTRCIDRARATLYRFYNNLEHLVLTPQNKKLFIDQSMGYTLERLLRPDINNLFVKRMEIHQNYRLNNPEIVYPLTNCLYLLFSKASISANMIKGTLYLNSESKSKPKTRIYHKTLELKEKYGVEIDGTFVRVEQDYTESVIKKQFGGLDILKLGYIHPENRNYTEDIISLNHREILFNNNLDNQFQENNCLSFFGKYVSLLFSSLRISDEDILEGNIGKTNYTYLDLLNLIYELGTIGEIEDRTGIPDRTLSRHFSRLVKEDIIYKDYSKKRYFLTPKGLILFDRKKELFGLFEIVFANFNNPSSNTIIQYTPDTIISLLKDTIDLSLFMEEDDDES